MWGFPEFSRTIRATIWAEFFFFWGGEIIHEVLGNALSLKCRVVESTLMYDPNSPNLDFYLFDFKLNLNGKKQNWGTIVTIPFMKTGCRMQWFVCSVMNDIQFTFT